MFEPPTAPGDYFVYYMIYRSRGSQNYPKGYYQPMERTADEVWLKTNGLDNPATALGRLSKFDQAGLVQFQSIDEFNSFYPMEVIATADEVRSLLGKRIRSPFLLFPEDREHPIKMTGDLPYRWIERGAFQKFSGTADCSEFYSFQVGLYAVASTIEDVRVRMTDLRGPGGNIIPGSRFSSFNTGGIDWKGKPFAKNIVVEKGHVQALWMGIAVPEKLLPGLYVGELFVAPKGMKEERIHIELDVSSTVIADHGDDDPHKLGRLRWLNSQLAADDGIVPPFTPVRTTDRVVSCLGHDVALTPTGFPERIMSHF